MFPRVDIPTVLNSKGWIFRRLCMPIGQYFQFSLHVFYMNQYLSNHAGCSYFLTDSEVEIVLIIFLFQKPWFQAVQIHVNYD